MNILWFSCRPRLSLAKNHSNSHSGPKRVTFLSENSLLQSGEKSESATLLTTLFATLESVYLQAKYFAILCNLPLPNAKQWLNFNKKTEQRNFCFVKCRFILWFLRFFGSQPKIMSKRVLKWVIYRNYELKITDNSEWKFTTQFTF